MKTIFCPVDFSDGSHLAAEWAVMLALKRNSSLILFNKFLISSQEDASDPLAAARAESERRLQEVKSLLIKKYQAENLTWHLETGFGIATEDVILKAAEKANADLIVMGTKGAESFGDIVGGSNTANVVMQTDIPVVVVPDSARLTLPETFVYASDLKDEDKINLDFVLDFAGDLSAGLTFLHINRPGEPSELAVLKEVISQQLTLTSGKGKVSNIEFEEIYGEDSFQALQEYMNSRQNGLVILGRNPKNFFEKFFKGDFTRLMTLYSFHPLLILHKID